MKLCFA